MFEWLEQEIATIKTRRFHIIDGAADAALRASVETGGGLFPRSYKEFVLRFGNAKLYKELDYYIVGVLAAPVEMESREREELYCIGHYDSADACFKATLLHGADESPIFEAHGGKLVQVADGFEAWLIANRQHIV
jgi:hypothetical protein